MIIEDNHSKYIDMIEQENLREFILEVISEYGTEEKLIKANEVCGAVHQLLTHKGLIIPQGDPRFLDSMMASGLLHNLFYSEEDPRWVFSARAELADKGQEDYKIGMGILDAIFQSIEGQFGEHSFIPHCRPTPNSPSDLFATTIWFVNNYKPEH